MEIRIIFNIYLDNVYTIGYCNTGVYVSAAL